MDQSQLILASLGGNGQDLTVVVESHGMNRSRQVADRAESLGFTRR